MRTPDSEWRSVSYTNPTANSVADMRPVFSEHDCVYSDVITTGLTNPEYEFSNPMEQVIIGHSGTREMDWKPDTLL